MSTLEHMATRTDSEERGQLTKGQHGERRRDSYRRERRASRRQGAERGEGADMEVKGGGRCRKK